MIAVVTDSEKEYREFLKTYDLDPKEYLYVSCVKHAMGRCFEEYIILEKAINIPFKEMWKIREYLESHKNG